MGEAHEGYVGSGGSEEIGLPQRWWGQEPRATLKLSPDTGHGGLCLSSQHLGRQKQEGSLSPGIRDLPEPYSETPFSTTRKKKKKDNKSKPFEDTREAQGRGGSGSHLPSALGDRGLQAVPVDVWTPPTPPPRPLQRVLQREL